MKKLAVPVTFALASAGTAIVAIAFAPQIVSLAAHIAVEYMRLVWSLSA